MDFDYFVIKEITCRNCHQKKISSEFRTSRGKPTYLCNECSNMMARKRRRVIKNTNPVTKYNTKLK